MGDIMDYDVIILGGGIVGCSVACKLSKYSFNIALIEKKCDVGYDVPKVNFSVFYNSAEEHIGRYYASFGKERYQKIYDLCKKLNVPLKNINILVDAENKKGKIENAAIMSPYDFTIACGEIAFDNGVNFKLSEKVINIKKISNGLKVITTKNRFTCSFIIDTIPEKILSENNLNYFLIDKNYKDKPDEIILDIYKDRKITIVPTLEGYTFFSVYMKQKLGLKETFEKCRKIFPDITEKYINIFRSIPFDYKNKISVDYSMFEKGYVKVHGKSYGREAVIPFITEEICKKIIKCKGCFPKKNFIDKRREIYHFRDMSDEERNKIIKLDKKYGKIICKCQNVTEGEIIDAIRRPLGARTVEGIERRTGIDFGDCMGSYCLDKIIYILARETNINMCDATKYSEKSRMFTGRIKEFGDM